jgi:hypothetical protein
VLDRRPIGRFFGAYLLQTIADLEMIALDYKKNPKLAPVKM